MKNEIKIIFTTKNFSDAERLNLITRLIEVLNVKGVDNLVINDTYEYSKETIKMLVEATKIVN